MSQSQTVSSGNAQEDCRFDDLLDRLTKHKRQLYQIPLDSEEAPDVIVSMALNGRDFMVVPISDVTVFIVSDDHWLQSLAPSPITEVTPLGVKILLRRRIGEVALSERWEKGGIAEYKSTFPRLWPGNERDEEAGASRKPA
jgi:hypothetical protein